MSASGKTQPSWWGTVGLLLRNARSRAVGRRLRAQQLLNQRTGKSATNWGGFGYFFAVVLYLFVNGLSAFMMITAVESGQRAEVEQQGKIVVSSGFYSYVREMSTRGRDNNAEVFGQPLNSAAPNQRVVSSEAKEISEKEGGSQPEIEAHLRSVIAEKGITGLVERQAAAPGIRSLAFTGRLPQMLGSLALLFWLMMLIFQGEGMEVDVQRRRYPMWEWLFSHPVQPGAVFLAEMLAPIAANPIYWAAPLFVAFAYGFVYGIPGGIISAFAVGLPAAVACACMGKALEVGVLLRFSPRTRGAVIGLMGWIGYTAMMLPIIGIYIVPRFVHAAAGLLQIFTVIPWPWLGLFLGLLPDGKFSFITGIITCDVLAVAATALAVWISVWGTQRGLAGNSSMERPKSAAAANRAARFSNTGVFKDPLYRKEFLWFTRDRSAIVQSLLVPLTVAGFQLVNLRGLLAKADGSWNYLCGVAIFFGTYFLWILGPKSLQSEGQALWITLTWPRGLESLLKAKAWLWSMISTGLVALILAYAALEFHADIWKIALVGIGWYFFARSMAEKSVTLVTVTSESGETQRPPKGRMWAAQLGMLTFAIGIVTQQWHLAVIGIVYSFVTAAAMWQNFRARLPYLYDPWSEQLPPAPTLMHAMISISILVELAAVLTLPVLAIGGRDSLGPARAFGYGVSAIVVSLFVANFMGNRNVRPQEIWNWVPAGAIEENEPLLKRYGIGDLGIIVPLLMGACGGLALGLGAKGYEALLLHIPSTADLIRQAQQQMTSVPNLHFWYMVTAVGFAPFAEEYLFRGLLFRALDREWGGWKAVLGAAAFFAVYHPLLSWPPVFLLGAINCLLFRKTGRLAPAVLLHMIYNAVVLN
ncbi:CPBP family intramembrane glutamic endopeptidase [Terracidiphilus gabretensis]|uniref:CPBP family intramembrane glutamic endopeptidase n=1 Tax=Terracidiphilus gabretensis TaxID=1577687 RepID=UPI00071B63E1|nr:CPBP family intramembrane glutamic endopeptidase [Terracidiphilus gabretensis]